MVHYFVKGSNGQVYFIHKNVIKWFDIDLRRRFSIIFLVCANTEPLSGLLLHMVYNHCHQVVISAFAASSEPEQRGDFLLV